MYIAVRIVADGILDIAGDEWKDLTGRISKVQAFW